MIITRRIAPRFQPIEMLIAIETIMLLAVNLVIFD